MFQDYKKYKDSDYLSDDFFVDSMLHPTQQSEIFWKSLIDNQEIDVNEFISAYRLLVELNNNKPDVPEDRLSLLWNSIMNTNQKKKKKIRLFATMRYAAIFILIVGLGGVGISLLNHNLKNETEMLISDFAQENIINTRDNNTEIQIISGSKIFKVEGAQAEVEYDANGALKVNQQSVDDNGSQKKQVQSPVYNTLKVPYGKRAFLTLSDGTSLWINTGTTVIYPISFASDKREIFVDGEVYAEVTHESSRPFIVKTEKLDVQVLGTVFNVAAYKADKQVNVVLVSGSVNVKPMNDKSTIMKPNQMFEFTDKYSTLSNIDVENYTSWHTGVYIFKNEPIEKVLLKLSRYYNVTMTLPSTHSGITCSGKLELKDDLMQLLSGLSEITPMTYGVKANVYRINFE